MRLLQNCKQQFQIWKQNNELKAEVDKQNEEVEALAKNVIARTKQLNKQAADMQTTSKVHGLTPLRRRVIV